MVRFVLRVFPNLLKSIFPSCAIVVSCSLPVTAGEMTTEQAQTIIAPLYLALTANAEGEVTRYLDQATTPDWKNCSSDQACQDRLATFQRWVNRVSIIPDYRLKQQQVLVVGTTVIVRSEASGTPAKKFLGLEPSGRSFKIMTIDVHEVRDGRIFRTYHVEDWSSAMKQLTQ